MRFAFLATQAADGSESELGRHVRDLARMLRLMGHETVLLGLTSARTDDGSDHVEGTRRRLLVESRREGPGDPCEVPEAGGWLDEERPDVVWLMQVRGAPDLVEAATARGIPVVSDLHGLTCALDRHLAEPGGERSEARLAGRVTRSEDQVRLVLAGSAAVVVHTPSERPVLGRHGVDECRVETVPLGVNHAAAAEVTGMNGAGGRPELHVRFTGPLWRPAGARVVLEAAARLPEHPLHVTIEGLGRADPDYETVLRSLARRDPRVEIVPEGGVSPPADLLAVPSLDAGDCPFAALGAMRDGIAVAASEASAVGDLLGGPGAKAVFPAGDPGALAALFREIVEHPGILAGFRPPTGLPGIEEEALGIERIARGLTEVEARPGAPRRRAGQRDEATALVGGGIDYPYDQTRVRRSALLVSGWALCEPHPVSRVEIALNGTPLGRARLGLARPVLLEAYADAEAAVCGWEQWVDLTALPDDVREARFDAEVVALDGSRFPLWPVTVEVGPPSRPDAEELERAGVLDERLDQRRGAGAGRVRHRDDVHLVVFGHDLRYGGAQLYLYELLRQLAPEPWLSCTVVATWDGPLRRCYEEMGFPVHVTQFPEVHSLDMYEGRIAELAAWVRQEGFNMALGNTLLASAGMDLAGRLGIPNVWAIHESYDLSVFWGEHLPDVHIDPVVGRRLTGAFGATSAMVFVADATRRMFERYGDPRRFVKIDYGIDVGHVDAYRSGFDRSAARARLGIPQSAEVLLWVGVIAPRKAQTALARAFRCVSAAYPDTYLVLVGDIGSAYCDALRDYLDAAGLSDRSRVVAFVDDPYEWYGVADLFVCPSDLESLPRTVLEAMAFELPVAAVRSFGLPELIEDGRTGYLAEPSDLGALRDLLLRVLAEPDGARREVGRASARMLRQRHDSAEYAAAYARLLRALAEDPRVLPADVLGTAAVGG